MIILSILSIIVAISLQPVNNNPLVSLARRDTITPILFARLSSIIFIYSGILNYNVLYFDKMDTGIGIYNGYYQVTPISLSIEIFMFIIGAIILMP
jgi:NADH-ubiquinone oxidoreductase chain 2